MSHPWIQRGLSWLTASLDETALVAALHRLVMARAERLPPERALTLLLSLDQRLYGLQGRHAVRLGQGLHVKHRLMDYHTFFTQRITQGERVLDLGCGSGAVAFDVARISGGVVTGLDNNPDTIARARQHYQHPNLAFLLGDVRHHPLAESFQVVILSNLLEHLEERPAFLRAVVAHTGARRLLLRVPMFERDWRVPLRRELGLEWRLDPTHHTEYTRESFLAELEQAALHPVEWQCRWGEFWVEARAP